MTSGATPELRLIAFVRAERGRPFVWGDTNCVALGLRALDAVHGGSDLHGRYRRFMASAARAYAWTQRHGARSIIERLIADGLTEASVAFARRGDLLVGDAADGQIAAHVCLGERVLSARADTGVCLLHRSALNPAPQWAVGWRVA